MASSVGQRYAALFDTIVDLRDGEAFPPAFYTPMRELWADAGIQECVTKGSEALIPEK